MLHTYLTVAWLPLPCEVIKTVHTASLDDVCNSNQLNQLRLQDSSSLFGSKLPFFKIVDAAHNDTENKEVFFFL